MLKKIGVGAALAVVAALAFIATRPSTFHLERRATIQAPVDVVMQQIVELRRWQDWSPWYSIEPTQKVTYSDPSSGERAWYSWQGDQVGEGKMTLLEVTPSRRALFKLEFIKPFASTSETSFVFVPDSDRTQVIWSMDGTNDFLGKAFSLLMDMDASVGGDFERGLASLKTVAEAEARTRATATAAASPGLIAGETAQAVAPPAPAVQGE